MTGVTRSACGRGGAVRSRKKKVPKKRAAPVDRVDDLEGFEALLSRVKIDEHSQIRTTPEFDEEEFSRKLLSHMKSDDWEEFNKPYPKLLRLIPGSILRRITV